MKVTRVNLYKNYTFQLVCLCLYFIAYPPSSSGRRGSHCVVEWDGPGSPRNVVLTKSVSGLGDNPQEFGIGDVCDVRIRQRAKMVPYKATLLAIGRYT